MLESLQSSWLAQAIGQSQIITALLSATHVLGFTLVIGSGVVSNLRLSGLLLSSVPDVEVVRPASRMLLLGVLVSGVTGFLLFVPRAEGAAANTFFRTKVSLIVMALVAHAAIRRPLAVRSVHRGLARAAGALGLALWLGVALAACAFILLE